MRPYGRSGMKQVTCPLWLSQRIMDYKGGKARLPIKAGFLSAERINCIFPIHRLNGSILSHLHISVMQKSLNVANRLKAFLDEIAATNLIGSDAQLALHKDREFMEK